VLVERGAVGDRQDLVEVVDVDDPEDLEVTEALPAAQPKIPEIDKHRFDCVGYGLGSLLDARQKQHSTELCGEEYPNRSDSWFNYDDVRMSMPWPPCELSSQNLALPK
jgi:hypothetical protein